MAKFTYKGPPGEPGVGMTEAFGHSWFVGHAVEIEDGDPALERIKRHPHFVEGEWKPEAPKAKAAAAPETSKKGASGDRY